MTTTTAPAPANPKRLPALSPRCDDLNYSVRRYFVDEFFQRHATDLPPGSRVIDVGGLKARKRGQFDISTFDLRVTIVNTSRAAEPDVVADAVSIPLPSAQADAVILSEVAEHLPDPRPALREAARLLRPGGVLLATAPFLFRVHPDPIDVGRYAPDWWAAALCETGFTDTVIEQQGMMFCVLAEFIRGWAKHLADTSAFWPGMESTALSIVRWAREQALAYESRLDPAAAAYYASYATGYGVRAVRRTQEPP